MKFEKKRAERRAGASSRESDVKAWMPLWIGDYMGDTMHLTTEQHGAYLLLMMHYWRNGPIPDDDTALAGIVRTNSSAWKRLLRPTVLECFFRLVEGQWRHERLDELLANARERRVKAAEKAQIAANRRWAGKGHEQSGGDAPSIAQALPGQCPSPSSSPSSSPCPALPATGERGGLVGSNACPQGKDEVVDFQGPKEETRKEEGHERQDAEADEAPFLEVEE